MGEQMSDIEIVKYYCTGCYQIISDVKYNSYIKRIVCGECGSLGLKELTPEQEKEIIENLK